MSTTNNKSKKGVNEISERPKFIFSNSFNILNKEHEISPKYLLINQPEIPKERHKMKNLNSVDQASKTVKVTINTSKDNNGFIGIIIRGNPTEDGKIVFLNNQAKFRLNIGDVVDVDVTLMKEKFYAGNILSDSPDTRIGEPLSIQLHHKKTQSQFNKSPQATFPERDVVDVDCRISYILERLNGEERKRTLALVARGLKRQEVPTARIAQTLIQTSQAKNKWSESLHALTSIRCPQKEAQALIDEIRNPKSATQKDTQGRRPKISAKTTLKACLPAKAYRSLMEGVMKDMKDPTIEDLSCLTEEEVKSCYQIGETFMTRIQEVLTRAGLKLSN